MVRIQLCEKVASYRRQKQHWEKHTTLYNTINHPNNLSTLILLPLTTLGQENTGIQRHPWRCKCITESLGGGSKIRKLGEDIIDLFVSKENTCINLKQTIK